jgi:hypothetical protein
VGQFREHIIHNLIPNRFIGEESAFAAKTADFSRDTAALRNDNSCNDSN